MFWLLLIALFLVLLMLIYSSVPLAENKVLFFPSKKSVWRPKGPHQNVYIDVNRPTKIRSEPKGDCIHGWYFNNYPGRKTVMFCHGNSGNISHRQYIVDICKKFEINLFIFDYRGFGKSSGKPCKRNLRKDGEAAYKFLTQYHQVKPKDLVIWGESLGGFVAIWTASKYKCRSLILLCTFSGLDDAITYYFTSGIGQSLASGYSSLVGLRYDTMLSRNYIRKVKCPTLILHSKEDDIIPYACAKILYQNIQHNSKSLLTIEGKHSSPKISKDVLNKLFMFCDISLPFYEKKHNIDKMLKNVETVAERYHNFID